MLDIALACFCLLLFAMGLRRPFIWVLAYIYVDIVAPQKIGFTIMPVLQISLVAFLLAFGGWLLLDSKQGSRFGPRQWLLLALLAWCAVTTFLWADFPVEAAGKWSWVWKALLFAIFLPLALRTKLRIEAAATVMVLAAAAIFISGGIKTVIGTGGYGQLVTLVQSNAGIYEGSTMSMAAIASIPLIWWIARRGTLFGQNLYVTLFAVALTFACLLIPVGTSTRTGLLCIVVLGVLLLRTVRYRFVFMGAAGLLALAAIPFLPAEYTERMGTIQNYQSDESASTRVQVWEWTLDYVKDHPLGGGFDAFRGNSFTFETVRRVEVGGVVSYERQEVTDEARAYHSAYFEVLGEQGWPGLFLWLAIHVGGLIKMEQLRRRSRKSDDPEQQRWGAFAVALQQAHIVYLVGALFIGIAFQPFMLMIVGLEIAIAARLDAERKAVVEEERKAALAARRQRAAPVGGPVPA